MTTGWKLTASCRERLLSLHPPRYVNGVADHVTLAVDGAAPPAPVRAAQIIGRADDGLGVEAMVVEIDGSTVRPDGLTWHVTWSLAEDRRARESNDVIAALGWTRIDPVPLELEPALW